MTHCGEPESALALLDRFQDLLGDLGEDALRRGAGTLVSNVLVVAHRMAAFGRLEQAGQVLDVLSSHPDIGDASTPLLRAERLRAYHLLRARVHAVRGLPLSTPMIEALETFRLRGPHDPGQVSVALVRAWEQLDVDAPDRALELMVGISAECPESERDPLVMLTTLVARVLCDPQALSREGVGALVRAWGHADGPVRECFSVLATAFERHNHVPVDELSSFLGDLPGSADRPRLDALRLEARAMEAFRCGEQRYFLTSLRELLQNPAASHSVPMCLVLTTEQERSVMCETVRSEGDERVRTLVERCLHYRPCPAREDSPPSLSPRELQVLGSIARGRTNTQIARTLGVTVHTVKFHRANLYRKLDARTKADMLRAAESFGIGMVG
ncbi:MAG: helix-turn-helix transcriptional regulator [Pauljensenia sp.]